MNALLQKSLVWALIALCTFALFRWLFGLGTPGAAFEFATGTTVIIMAGLLSGTYAARLWYKADRNTWDKVAITLIASTIVCLFLIGFFINKLIERTQFNYFFFAVISLFLINAFAATLVSLIRHRIKTSIRSARTALAQSQTELQLIQAQLSPHFLFNTLNNLYGFSITDHQKVPPLILKLSELLRYSVYEAKEMFVPLKDEVNYLKNYIDFEKIRLEERLSLTLEIEDVVDPSVTIAPMLLIVFVENAFKHSKNNEDKKIYIQIALSTNNGSIFFMVENSCSPQTSSSTPPKSHSGFGLESVKKRVDLLYTGRHELRITRSERSYSATLIVRPK